MAGVAVGITLEVVLVLRRRLPEIADGLDLRGPMRAGASDEELKALIAGCWTTRRDRYSEQRSELTIRPKRRVQMFQVGG